MRTPACCEPSSWWSPRSPLYVLKLTKLCRVSYFKQKRTFLVSKKVNECHFVSCHKSETVTSERPEAVCRCAPHSLLLLISEVHRKMTGICFAQNERIPLKINYNLMVAGDFKQE